MSGSAGDSPASEARPCIGTEIEYPVVTHAGAPAEPETLARLWPDLASHGWTAGAFGATRPHPTARVTLTSHQALSTDTGPIVEIASAPADTLDALAAQVSSLRKEAAAALDRVGCAMVAAGVHPSLQAEPDQYYRYRTPRPAYDYAIDQRGWQHWTIVDKAAVQEVVDVSVRDAPRAIAVLHRLSGLMNVVLRNDPGLYGPHAGRLSVRPLAWRDHVPHDGPFGGDAQRVLVPSHAITNWRSYLSLLWEASPMFLVGTKDQGLAYVPAHPSFMDFLRRAPADGWDARLLDGTPVRVHPEVAHVVATDWTYMGCARIRWKWRTDGPGVSEILKAWDADAIDALLDEALEKVVIENRGNATQPEEDSLVSVALVAGLLANLDDVEAFTRTEPYAFWTSLLDASTSLPLTSRWQGRDVPDLVWELTRLAERGLVRRGERTPEQWLAPIRRRVAEGMSPAERWLADGPPLSI